MRRASRSSSRSTTRATRSSRCLDRLFESVTLPCEVLVVFDTPRRHDDPRTSRSTRRTEPRLRSLVNTYGRGPANAIRFGIDARRGRRSSSSPWPTAATTRGRSTTWSGWSSAGVVVAAASRYMPGGQQVGGPLPQGHAVADGRRLAATGPGPRRHPRRHQLLQGVLDREFVREVGIESDDGFEIGIELVAKARRLAPAGGRDPDHLARPAGGRVELPGRAVDSQLPALVPLRLRAAPDSRADTRARRRAEPRATAGPGRSPSPASPARFRHMEDTEGTRGTDGESSGQRIGRVHRRLRREELLGRGHAVVGVDNYSKYGKVTQVLRRPPELPPGRGRRPRRRADDGACSRTATTSSPVRR